MNSMLPQLWAAFHNQDEIRYQSSSGGVFSALAAAIFDRNGIVYGAAMTEEDSDQCCRHVSCECRGELHRLRGSKYTVSDVRGVFLSVKKELERGRVVLFSGTPCQVAALYAFLGKRYDHLITVDFICHGVPAPTVLRKFLAEKEQNHHKKVRRVDFRDKTEGWKDYSVKVEFEDGSADRKIWKQSTYMRMFLSDLYLRPSCYRCRFKGTDHCSDITLGDFWNIQDYLVVSEETLQKGISAVVLRTEIGNQLFAAASKELTTQKSSMDYFICSNRSYFESAIPSLDIALFRCILKEWPIDRILWAYERSDKIRTFVKRAVRKAGKLLRGGFTKKKRRSGLPSKEDCCGCLNCVTVCPANAIRVVKDDLGFVYPEVVRQACVSCGRCEAVCPCCKKG